MKHMIPSNKWVTREWVVLAGQCSEGGAMKALTRPRVALMSSLGGPKYPVETLALLPTYWSSPRGLVKLVTYPLKEGRILQTSVILTCKHCPSEFL